jgi:hypothetical protein
MNAITMEQLTSLLPLATRWAEAQERVVLREGVPLTPAQAADAARIGVVHPEQVRVLVVEEMPSPDDPALKLAAKVTGLASSLSIGLTFRYGIYIRSDCWDDRQFLMHELAHTAQYERLGGIDPFLKQYLHECLTSGYPNGPLEQEARRIEREIRELPEH